MSPLAPCPPALPHADPDAEAAVVAHAVTRRDQRGVDLDGALRRFVRGARAGGEPVERTLARLKALLHAHVRPLRPEDDPHEVIALVMRRAITAYYTA